MSESVTVTSKKAHPDNEDLDGLSKNELIARLKEQEQYIKQLESKKPKLDKDDDVETGDRLKVQQKEAARKENTLVHRLTLKEGELQDYVNQITEIKQAQAQGTAQLRTMLLDPAVNIVFQRMSKEMDEAQEKLKQTQNELSAWKFTPDSQTGKRLMARCQMLLQENEELGKTISSGRTAKLEGEIALQKTLVTEMKNNQSELDEFLGDLEEDVEGMQTMIYVLQQQLRESKEQITALEEENAHLRNGGTSDHYKTFTVKERDKFDHEVKSKTTRHTEYDTYKDKPHTDYAPMETGYYQNDKTDSDIEAEYTYEGLYENDDKYQEELEARQKDEDGAKQFEYEENGYRNYGDEYESQTHPESMDTSELEDSSQVHPDNKLTSPPEVQVKEEPSYSTHTTNNNESNRQQMTISSMDTDTQHSEQTTESMANVKTEVAEIVNNPVGNGQHLDNSKENVSKVQEINRDITPDKQRTTQENDTEITPEKHSKISKEELIERTTEKNEVATSEVAKERTPERQSIPSPKPSKNSPGKTNCTNTTNSDKKEDKSNANNSNSVTDTSPGKGSPKQLNKTDIKDNSSPLTESNSNTSKEKTKLREREPVLQQFLNGITSTIDDIEDL